MALIPTYSVISRHEHLYFIRIEGPIKGKRHPRGASYTGSMQTGENGHSDSLANYLNLHSQSSTVPTLKDFKLEIGCCPGTGVMCFLHL